MTEKVLALSLWCVSPYYVPRCTITDIHDQQTIYDQIRKREIVMPEEHTGQVGFEYAWKELLARSKQAGTIELTLRRTGLLGHSAGSYISHNTPIFDKKMFEAIWKPVISAVAYAFTSFEDDHIIERSIAGFRQCATLAGYLVLPDVFDYVVVSLSQATSLLSEQLPTRVPNYPVVTVENQLVTVSTLSVKFGTNFRGQLAAVVLFNIVNGNGNALREGWTQVCWNRCVATVRDLLADRYSRCLRTCSYTAYSPQVCCRWRIS